MVKISELLTEPQFQHLELIAGQAGIHKSFSGINVIESADLVPFCRPNELIVTTGIHMNHDEKKLEKLVKSSYSKRVAGFIINIGPFIPQVPNSVIQFANEKQLPLFQFEWKYRIADLLKMTFEFISKKQKLNYRKNSEETILQHLLFDMDVSNEDIESVLQQQGISKDVSFSIVTCLLNNDSKNLFQYRKIIDYELQQWLKKFLCLEHNNQLIYLIFSHHEHSTKFPIESIANNIYKKEQEKFGNRQLTIGMGNIYPSLKQIRNSYNESLTVIHLTKLQNNSTFIKYKDIGAYKIIMALYDDPVITSFRQEMLGPLYVYDEMNSSDFVPFLKTFLEENGSINKISKKLFLHRNTVNYKIRKLESLLDVDLNDNFTKTNLSIALMIEDVLNQSS